MTWYFWSVVRPSWRSLLRSWVANSDARSQIDVVHVKSFGAVICYAPRRTAYRHVDLREVVEEIVTNVIDAVDTS